MVNSITRKSRPSIYYRLGRFLILLIMTLFSLIQIFSLNECVDIKKGTFCYVMVWSLENGLSAAIWIFIIIAGMFIKYFYIRPKMIKLQKQLSSELTVFNQEDAGKLYWELV